MTYGTSSNPCTVDAYICGHRFSFAALSLSRPEHPLMSLPIVRPIGRYEVNARGPVIAIRLMDAMYLGGELRIVLADDPTHTLIYSGPQEALVEVVPVGYEGQIIASFVFGEAAEM